MIWHWMALAVLAATRPAAGPRLEAAVFIPPAAGLVLSDQTVLHDARRGVTLVPNVPREALAGLFDGQRGRLVVAGATTLDGQPAIHLPLGSGELTYLALRDGRPQPVAVVNPAAVHITARPTFSKTGARLSFNLQVIQFTGQEPLAQANNLPVGAPSFVQQAVGLQQTLAWEQPLLVLLASSEQVAVGQQQVEVNFRGRVGNQTVESAAPLLGLVLRLVPAGGSLLFDQYQPPVAPPGQVAVAGAGPAETQAYQEGTTAAEALRRAGLPRSGPVELSRLGTDGNVERRQLRDRAALEQLPLQARDRLRVLPADSPAKSSVPSGGAPAATGSASAGGEPADPDDTELDEPTRGGPSPAPRPTAPGASGGTPAAPAPATRPLAQQTSLPPGGYPNLAPSRSLKLDELKRVEPAAAVASRAAVVLRARVQRGDEERELLLAGTLVSADGYLVTSPATVLQGATQLRAALADGREFACRRVGVDGTGALLLLRIEASDLPHLTPYRGYPNVGAPVVLVGHPHGLERSVTVTVVGGQRRQLAAAPGAELQLDGLLAAGNSGGPVVDLDGRLVGVAFGSISAGEPGPDISLAVPGTLIAEFLAAVRR
ncbi:MAG: trypsin-like peptidase domain-containing protein [Fimbriimonadaceae bacterium]|nr:trypsin-like peptidase domain-containing protein [Fimbriimonadaceae bacterium]